MWTGGHTGGSGAVGNCCFLASVSALNIPDNPQETLRVINGGDLLPACQTRQRITTFLSAPRPRILVENTHESQSLMEN